jgi:pimeloyl-ACP methyl ester carboxylesterase
MGLRGWFAITGIGLLMVLAGPAGAARSTDAPALTGAQLLKLHAITAWDIDYSETIATNAVSIRSGDTIVGAGFHTPFTSTATLTASRTITSHATVTGRFDPTDCAFVPGAPPTNPCVPDLSLPLHVSAADSHSYTQRTDYETGCIQDDGVSIGAGSATDSETWGAAASWTPSTLPLDELNGSFLINYGVNPPQLVGAMSMSVLKRNVGSADTNLSCYGQAPTSSPRDLNVTGKVFDTWGRGSDTSIRVVNGHFVVEGSITFSENVCLSDAATCAATPEGSTVYDAQWTVREHQATPLIDDVVAQQADIPTGAMRTVPESGTFDGNRVQLAITLANPTATSQDLQVEVVDADSGLPVNLTGSPTATVPAGGMAPVTLTWDTTGKAWNNDLTPSTVHHFTITLKNAAGDVTWDTADKTIKVLPKPIVLVHGWNSSAATWATLQSYLTDHYPYWHTYAVNTMNTGSLADPLAPSNTITQNAQAEDAYVRAVRSETEAQHVDLLVHSMGGLISRRYIQDYMPSDAIDGKPVVGHLVMLGTPNLGSPCAYLIPWPQPSSFELRPDYIGIFNLLVTSRRGVPFSILAGVPIASTCLMAGPGDGVVDLQSALQGGAIGDSFIDSSFASLHTSMPSATANFESFVKPRLAGGAAPTPRLRRRLSSVQRPLAALLSDVQPQLLATDGVPLAAGEIRTVSFGVSGASAIGGVLLAPGSVSAALKAPDGSIASILPDGALNPAEPFRSLTDIASPADGQWTLVLTNTGATATSAAYSIWETGETAMLDVTAQDLRDGTARISASLFRGAAAVTGEDVQATVRSLDGATQSLTLAAASDGNYTGRITLAPSEYLVTVRASGSVGRSTFQRLQVGAPGAAPPATNQPTRPTPSAPVTPPSSRRGAPVLTRGGAFAPPTRLTIRGRVATAAGSLTVDEPVILQLRVTGRKGSAHVLAGSALANVRSGKLRTNIVAHLSAGGAVRYRILLPAAELARTGADVIVDAIAADGQRSTLRIHFRR